MTTTAIPTPHLPQPLSLLLRQLDAALDAAQWEATVAPSEDKTALAVTVWSHKAPWGRQLEEAAGWLRRAGIDASVSIYDNSAAVVTLTTETAVSQFISTLLNPWTTANTAASALLNQLEDHGVPCETLRIDTHRIDLGLPSEELESARTLAEVLGAETIGNDLELYRKRGMTRLADRIRWLIGGIVGSTVAAAAEPGCAHESPHLTLGLTIDQARLLTQRLAGSEPE